MPQLGRVGLAFTSASKNLVVVPCTGVLVAASDCGKFDSDSLIYIKSSGVSCVTDDNFVLQAMINYQNPHVHNTPFYTLWLVGGFFILIVGKHMPKITWLNVCVKIIVAFHAMVVESSGSCTSGHWALAFDNYQLGRLAHDSKLDSRMEIVLHHWPNTQEINTAAMLQWRNK